MEHFICQELCRCCFLSHASIIFLLNIVHNIFSFNYIWRGIWAEEQILCKFSDNEIFFARENNLTVLFNWFKSGILFMGHRQTV